MDEEAAVMGPEALQLIKDLCSSYSNLQILEMAANEGTNTTMADSGKLLLQPADLGDDLDDERGKSSASEKADEEMAYEAKNFALYQRYWESAWSETCGTFEDMTALSSMQFTYYTPGRSPPHCAASTPPTLQILSVKLAELAGGLGWPLSVYGVVAVRDVVDHNRNYLFSCERYNSQELTQNDPFLRLVGPSRAVVYTDMVNFEIELKVKGTKESQDKALITEGRDYDGVLGAVSTVCFNNCFCTIETCLQVVTKTTQATILGVQVAKDKGRPYPFKYGARVTCSPQPGKSAVSDIQATCATSAASGEIVMVDSKDGAMLKGADGYLHLPRTVISVDSRGRLDVEIQSYSESGEIAAQDHVSFVPKLSKITRKKCFVRGVMVVITVAWSLVANDKDDLVALGCMV